MFVVLFRTTPLADGKDLLTAGDIALTHDGKFVGSVGDSEEVGAVIARQLAKAVGSGVVLTLLVSVGITLVTADGIGVGLGVGQEFAQLHAQARD